MRKRLPGFLSVIYLAGAAAAAGEDVTARADAAATPSAFGAALTFTVAVPYDRAVLAVSGPTGLVLDKEFAAGITPSFSAAGEGGPTPDGRYNYALRIRQATGRVVRDSQDPSRTAREERTITRRGSFRVRGGAIVLDDDAARSGDEAAR